MNDDYTHRTIRRRGRLTRGDAASLINAWQRSGELPEGVKRKAPIKIGGE